MTCKFPKIIRPRKRILTLFLLLSNAPENRARTDSGLTPPERPEFPTCRKTRPRFRTGHPQRRAQEARQRVFIASKGSDTGSPCKNATAGRWQAGVDSGTPTQ